MRVLLRKGHHSVYDDLVKHPPKGIEYKLPSFVTASKSKAKDTVKKRLFQNYLKIFNKPHAIYVNPKDTELIHACSGILIKNKFPWVIDTEHAASFVGFHAGRLEKLHRKVEDYLSSDWCRKIMPWSEAGRTSIINGLNTSRFREKIETVYPAIKPVDVKKKKHSGLNLLFISVRFYTKGGRELLEAYEALTRKYDYNFTVISHVPEAVKRKHPRIEFHEPNIPRQRLLDEFYPKTDIFILPSYMDTFGMVFLEAMSCGIPIVTTNVFAIPEIVGKAGLTVDVSRFSWYGKNCLFAWDSWEKFSDYCKNRPKPDVVEGIAEKTSSLLDSRTLRERMGRAGRKEVENGRFSLQRRNKKLKRIYEAALKG